MLAGGDQEPTVPCEQVINQVGEEALRQLLARSLKVWACWNPSRKAVRRCAW